MISTTLVMMRTIDARFLEHICSLKVVSRFSQSEEVNRSNNVILNVVKMVNGLWCLQISWRPINARPSANTARTIPLSIKIYVITTQHAATKADAFYCKNNWLSLVIMMEADVQVPYCLYSSWWLSSHYCEGRHYDGCRWPEYTILCCHTTTTCSLHNLDTEPGFSTFPREPDALLLPHLARRNHQGDTTPWFISRGLMYTINNLAEGEGRRVFFTQTHSKPYGVLHRSDDYMQSQW